MTDWKHIGTAPKSPEGEKDGPPVLLWNAYNHVIYHAFWSVYRTDLGYLHSGWCLKESPNTDPKPVPYAHRITQWAAASPPPPQEGE